MFHRPNVNGNKRRDALNPVSNNLLLVGGTNMNKEDKETCMYMATENSNMMHRQRQRDEESVNLIPPPQAGVPFEVRSQPPLYDQSYYRNETIYPPPSPSHYSPQQQEQQQQLSYFVQGYGHPQSSNWQMTTAVPVPPAASYTPNSGYLMPSVYPAPLINSISSGSYSSSYRSSRTSSTTYGSSLTSSYGSMDGSGYGRQCSNSRRNGNGRRQNERRRSANGWGFDHQMSCRHFKERIFEITKDYEGSRYLQRRLEIADTTEVKLVYDEVLPHLEELMNDPCGNYVLQRLLEHGTQDMKETVGRRVLDEGVVDLSFKGYGCRLVQGALETLHRDDVSNIVLALRGEVLALILDNNGNHVVQKAIVVVNAFASMAADSTAKIGSHQPDDDDNCGDNRETEDILSCLDHVVDEVTDNMEQLATHPYGCRVVQRLLEHSADVHKNRVLDSIMSIESFVSLFNHQYGNYVCQCALDHGRTCDKDAVFEAIMSDKNQLIRVSKEKHSSNVVEKMFKNGSLEQRKKIVDEMLNAFVTEHNQTVNAAVFMAQNPYGNYVVKTALDVLEVGEQRDRLFNMLLSSYDNLDQSQYAKHIVVRLRSYAEERAR